jgi:hypothetical protein
MELSMAADRFVAAVASEMNRILNSPGDAARLGLAPDIVRGWQGYFLHESPSAMADKIRKVALDNKIALDAYEPDRARQAAEMILSTVDAFYRRMVAPRTMS